MSLLAWLGGPGRAQRRLLNQSDMRFCARIELAGFEAYHAIRDQAFHVIVPAHDHQPIAARAARLYFEDAASITVVGDGSADRALREEASLVVRAEPLANGRFRVVVATKQDAA